MVGRKFRGHLVKRRIDGETFRNSWIFVVNSCKYHLNTELNSDTFQSSKASDFAANRIGIIDPVQELEPARDETIRLMEITGIYIGRRCIFIGIYIVYMLYLSMDWLKGKPEPETIDFTIKSYGLSEVTFPLNQSIESKAILLDHAILDTTLVCHGLTMNVDSNHFDFRRDGNTLRCQHGNFVHPQFMDVFPLKKNRIYTVGVLLIIIIGYLVGGLEHGFYDFPFSWEWKNHPN